MVAGTASPDDPLLPEYWAQRRRRSRPPVGATTLRLLRAQHGRCPLCRDLLLHADREPQSPHEWEQWLTATRKAIRKHAVTVWGAARRRNAPQLVSYMPTATAEPPAETRAQHLCTPTRHQGLLEPVARKPGTAGSKVAPAQQCAGATRRDLERYHHRKLIRCGTLSSVKALNKAIESFVAHWNSDCGPIAWTATAEEILDKVRTVTSRMEALLRATEINDVARHAA